MLVEGRKKKTKPTTILTFNKSQNDNDKYIINSYVFYLVYK